MVSLLRAFPYVTLFGMTTMNASVVRSRSTPAFPPISSRVLQFAREWANKQDFWSGYCVIQLLPSHSFSKWVDKRQDKISRRFVLHVFRVSRDSQDEACDTEPFGLFRGYSFAMFFSITFRCVGQNRIRCSRRFSMA